MPPRLVVGARVQCYLNGKLYAQTTGFQYSSGTQHRAIYGIDSGEPFELAPTVTHLTGSVSVLRMIGDGGLQGPGVVARYEDIPKEKYFTIMLLDYSTDTVLFRADQCKCISESWQIPAKGYMTGSMTFESISWSNEIHATEEP